MAQNVTEPSNYLFFNIPYLQNRNQTASAELKLKPNL